MSKLQNSIEKEKMLEELSKENFLYKRVSNDYLKAIINLRKSLSKFLFLEGIDNFKFFLFNSKKNVEIPQGDVFINVKLKKRSLKSTDSQAFFSDKKHLKVMTSAEKPDLFFFPMANLFDIEVRSSDELTLIKAVHALESSILIEKNKIFENAAVDYDILPLDSDESQHFGLKFEIKFVTNFLYKKFILKEFTVDQIVFYTENPNEVDDLAINA